MNTDHDKTIRELLFKLMSENNFLDFQIEEKFRGHDGKRTEARFICVERPKNKWFGANLYIDGNKVGQVEDMPMQDKMYQALINPALGMAYSSNPYTKKVLEMQAEQEKEMAEMRARGIDARPRDVIIKKGASIGPTELFLRNPNMPGIKMPTMEDILKDMNSAHLKVFGTPFPFRAKIKNRVEKKTVQKRKVKKPSKKRPTPGGQLVFGSAASAQRLRGREVNYQWLDDPDA